MVGLSVLACMRTISVPRAVAGKVLLLLLLLELELWLWLWWTAEEEVCIERGGDAERILEGGEDDEKVGGWTSLPVICSLVRNLRLSK